ncbi:hippocampus abundant transcript 1 protein isoform X2 [Neltuma alba]|uniref:hippocampus abundant transcript 1 protein isoform X2 n=1 Tax=Neltuma alba TaxID=207710 RepID=UPI0010A35E7B|nr:hippocampus abundant transcript 1 protein-like isoform X2 [Prosopis alba]
MAMESIIKELRHLLVTVFLTGLASFIVVPAITDVTIAALCPSQPQCSLAIFLSGFQQAATGVGAVVMTPLVGNLSDQYGRKALLTLPLTVSIIPLVILACSRATSYFYAYYAVKTVAAMVGEGSVNCLTLAYVADKIEEHKRTSAFGIIGGVASAAFVCGTLAARFLSTALTFQVSAVLSMIAVVYMRIFLPESVPVRASGLRQPMLDESEEAHVKEEREITDSAQRTSGIFKRLPSVRNAICLLKRSPTFSQAALVMFFNSLADGGLQTAILYYLKARFQFNKTQFADLMLIGGIGATLTQLLLMPIIVPALGEEKLLTAGLLVGCINVPYAIAMCSAFGVVVRPSICSIASKQVGPREQGMVQGSLSGISSFANIISPLIFSPLTALFLSEKAPFDFPGFSIMCAALAMIIAFIQSIMIRVDPSDVGGKGCADPLV